jgi:hypothetical protein
MNEKEIEHERRADVTWQRPTWPFARGSFNSSFYEHYEDTLGILASSSKARKPKDTPASPFPLASSEARALTIMNLNYPFTKKDLKARYIELAKKHHPDLNDGSYKAEEFLKSVNNAYEILKKLTEI